MQYKQAIIVRDDLKLPKGKMSAQAAHAAVEAVLRCELKLVKSWRAEGMGKIVLKVAGLKELYEVLEHAKGLGLATCVITDAGHTVVEPGTVTCAGIGPARAEDVDLVIAKLKLA